MAFAPKDTSVAPKVESIRLCTAKRTIILGPLQPSPLNFLVLMKVSQSEKVALCPSLSINLRQSSLGFPELNLIERFNHPRTADTSWNASCDLALNSEPVKSIKISSCFRIQIYKNSNSQSNLVSLLPKSLSDVRFGISRFWHACTCTPWTSCIANILRSFQHMSGQPHGCLSQAIAESGT